MRRMYSENQLVKIIADNVGKATSLLDGFLYLEDFEGDTYVKIDAPLRVSGWDTIYTFDGNVESLQDALDEKQDKELEYVYNISYSSGDWTGNVYIRTNREFASYDDFLDSIRLPSPPSGQTIVAYSYMVGTYALNNDTNDEPFGVYLARWTQLTGSTTIVLSVETTSRPTNEPGLNLSSVVVDSMSEDGAFYGATVLNKIKVN